MCVCVCDYFVCLGMNPRRYLDTNYVNALSRANMEADRLRRSVLGAIRYGKPLVLDLMDVDVWESIQFDFDMIKKGLLQVRRT